MEGNPNETYNNNKKKTHSETRTSEGLKTSRRDKIYYMATKKEPPPPYFTQNFISF